MPPILALGGFEILMFSSDKPPPYVHAKTSSGWIKIALGDDEESVHTFGKFGMERWEIRRAEMIVRSCRVRLLKKWEELHEPTH